MFGHSSAGTVRNTDVAINLTQVKNESENQTQPLIEIDDSSDDEAAVEIKRDSNESVRDVTKPPILYVLGFGTEAQENYDQLEQNRKSDSSKKLANDVNAFRVGSKIISRCQSKATNGKERNIFENVVNTSAGSSNDDSANCV